MTREWQALMRDYPYVVARSAEDGSQRLRGDRHALSSGIFEDQLTRARPVPAEVDDVRAMLIQCLQDVGRSGCPSVLQDHGIAEFRGSNALSNGADFLIDAETRCVNWSGCHVEHGDWPYDRRIGCRGLFVYQVPRGFAVGFQNASHSALCDKPLAAESSGLVIDGGACGGQYGSGIDLLHRAGCAAARLPPHELSFLTAFRRSGQRTGSPGISGIVSPVSHSRETHPTSWQSLTHGTLAATSAPSVFTSLAASTWPGIVSVQPSFLPPTRMLRSCFM